jgi:hypothetical protein
MIFARILVLRIYRIAGTGDGVMSTSEQASFRETSISRIGCASRSKGTEFYLDCQGKSVGSVQLTVAVLASFQPLSEPIR